MQIDSEFIIIALGTFLITFIPGYFILTGIMQRQHNKEMKKLYKKYSNRF